MNKKKEPDYLEFTAGSVMLGLGLVAVIAMYVYGEFSGAFSSVKTTLGAFVEIAGVVLLAYFVFIIGVEIYNVALKKLEFLRNPTFKAIGVLVVLTAIAWAICFFNGDAPKW